MTKQKQIKTRKYSLDFRKNTRIFPGSMECTILTNSLKKIEPIKYFNNQTAKLSDAIPFFGPSPLLVWKSCQIEISFN